MRTIFCNFPIGFPSGCTTLVATPWKNGMDGLHAFLQKRHMIGIKTWFKNANGGIATSLGSSLPILITLIKSKMAKKHFVRVTLCKGATMCWWCSKLVLRLKRMIVGTPIGEWRNVWHKECVPIPPTAAQWYIVHNACASCAVFQCRTMSTLQTNWNTPNSDKILWETRRVFDWKTRIAQLACFCVASVWKTALLLQNLSSLFFYPFSNTCFFQSNFDTKTPVTNQCTPNKNTHKDTRQWYEDARTFVIERMNGKFYMTIKSIALSSKCSVKLLVYSPIGVIRTSRTSLAIKNHAVPKKVNDFANSAAWLSTLSSGCA